ncbi:dTMP kinase [Nanoarchaeota archaeon NZ13-N]|uniref:Probable thymidylate kinase n=1 Tax=Candidatus Nanoclepta minutus TaxID=1940235 RepID=A0A397WN62_9ARCH|nr:MAG: dTMP kinase [Nanoarchaeota archaeon NZ13-N]RIB35524.1 MAG: dTMP kinase [Candidatus Nanoclepta minutus]
MLIVIEGIDGCGKTTIAELLKNILENKGYKVYLTKEPFRSDIKAIIKSIIEKKHDLNENFGKALSLLFAADRQIHQLEIKDKISKGFIVILDRYYHSSYTYQLLYKGVTLDFLEKINSSLLKPDYVFILDVPVDVAIERLMKRGITTEYERKDFLEKVRENYLKLKEILKEEKIFIINNNRNPEETIRDILSIIGIK